MSDQGFAPRAPRVKITIIHNLLFRADGVEVASQIANISHTGVALLREAHNADWKSDMILKGTMLIESESYQVTLNIVHGNKELYGASFVPPHGALSERLTRYFQSELEALERKKGGP